jgi:nitrate/TMAO reductase-like tetraheme cytochrome c subunit
VVALLILPLFLFAGLVIVPLGMWVEWGKRRRREAVASRFPSIDLNDPKQLKLTFIAVAGAFFIFVIFIVVVYQGYHFTESTEFCGKLCHQVMSPEYTAYQNSPHARVGCAECHVGPGAGFFVKSKLSGLYQVYATILDIYPRPIPTPIKNLRPAQETCEECHWPEQFFAAKQKIFHHFMPDDKNTEYQIDMLIKTGGGSPVSGQTIGIHWHMNILNQIEFIASDCTLTDIVYIKKTDKLTDTVLEFKKADDPIPDSALIGKELHRMDCIDCHNRPTHIYPTVSQSVNLALAAKRLNSKLPGMKEFAVSTLVAEYASTEEAMAEIAKAVSAKYVEMTDTIGTDYRIETAQTIKTLRDIYSKTFFPEMKVRWSVYPDNIGHMTFPGCFRCHDGKHTTANGRAISQDCDICHSITRIKFGDNEYFATSEKGLEFIHPEDIGEAWNEAGCYECHTGELP